MVISCRNATSENCQQMVQRPVVLSSRRTEEGGISRAGIPRFWVRGIKISFLRNEILILQKSLKPTFHL